MELRGSCTTSSSIVVPDGMTLDGRGHAIVAIDPDADTFRGGIVVARGGFASVINTVVTAAGLADVCHGGAERLRGIYFEGASGIIRDNRIEHVNKAGSVCQEGNGIEVRNSTNTDVPVTVEISGNIVARYQKSGVVIHGHVDAYMHLNVIGASAAQALVPANAIQVGPLAKARIVANVITGNTFAGTESAGTAVLLVDTAPGTLVSGNSIEGGDVGIHVLASGAAIEDNELTDAEPDGAYDVGIVNLGEGNLFGNNTVRGYRTRYYGIESAAKSQQVE